MDINKRYKQGELAPDVAKTKNEKLAKQHPVEREDAGLNFLMGSGKREVKAYKKYIKDRANVREKARSNKKKYGITNL